MGHVITTQPSAKLRALIVEDDPFVMIDMEDMLSSIGLDIAGMALSKDDALSQIATKQFDIATIDYDLGGETSEDIAVNLAAKGIPFVLVSGKASFVRNAPEFRDHPVLEKPVSEHLLAETLESMIA